MGFILTSGLFSAADSYGSGTATVEIIIMLLVAFILGYLLRYFLDGNSKNANYKLKYEDLGHRYALIDNQTELYKKENRKLLVKIEECKAKLSAKEFVKNDNKLGFTNTIVNEKKAPQKKDNLKRIEGIGPKIEQLLFDAEIYSWKQLSETEISVIQKVLDNAGPNYKVHNPESWPFQAGLAASAKWNELKKWQDEHKGGRY
jgi:predicted flap endonuclease-1-like 5' DNA nuclease